MADRPADDDEGVSCPFCGSVDEVERRGSEWCCTVCGRCWLAFSGLDKRWLKWLRIATD